jgi:hypothetical protein
VETGSLRLPDLGIDLRLSAKDVEALADLELELRDDTLTLIRFGAGSTVVVGADQSTRQLAAKELARVQERIPRPIELRTDLPLPDSISLDILLDRALGPLSDRQRRFALSDALQQLTALTTDVISSSAASIAGVFQNAPVELSETDLASQNLAVSLLTDVAHIDRDAFVDLEQALRLGEEGRVGGLIEEMNRSLARHLNFSRWWRQDKDFQLRLAPRERELVFTIRDRTGTDYSFRERSRGLTYFLSYFVQLRAHRSQEDFPEILLMDEPDAFLSSMGQQDLLRTLEDFVWPAGATSHNQVVYVTHSPFLINKNAADRVRVLDKGSDEEGTRVVRDAAQNRYEPLRSALGTFVAETAFIGGANLMVEGLADQVLLAGISSLLRRGDHPPRDLLDLNEVTIVPAGGADSLPYMVYLARGRDAVKPACVVLVDGDAQGAGVVRRLRRSDTDGKVLLRPDDIVDLAAWARQSQLEVPADVEVTEIEDLVAPTVLTAAAQNYAVRLAALSRDDAKQLNVDAVLAQLPDAGGRLWKALQRAFEERFQDAHIDKVGLAKEVVAYLESGWDEPRRPAGLPATEANFAKLLAHLALRLAEAQEREAESRRSRRSRRIVDGFVKDYPESATRDDALTVLRSIDAGLEETLEDEAIRQRLHVLRREFKLTQNPLDPIDDYSDFLARLSELKYQGRFAHREQQET